jgi:PIN domain nuclease of toxin-antitoxin system
MIVGVADTHAAIWYLSGSSRLSPDARLFIDAATDDGEEIGISSISLVEIVYLIEKGKIPIESLSVLAAELLSTGVFVEVVLDLKIARTLSSVDITQVPDMPDRIIAATAVHLNVPIISRDAKIRLSGINTIW